MAASGPKPSPVVLGKVKNYPGYEDKSEDELTQIARELTDRELLFKRFDNLVPSDDEARRRATKEDDGVFTHSTEKEMAHQRANHEMALNCHLPVKLFFSRLQRVDESVKFVTSKFYNLFFTFGAMHAGLLVGNIRVEWGKESLVDPQWEDDPALMDEQFAAHIHPQGNWALAAADFNRKFSLADRERRFEDKIQLMLDSTKEKRQLINNLLDVIVRYNRTKHYNLLTCNCQHFVIDAMKALGIEELPKFSGELNKYLQQLRECKGHVPDRFNDHASLDAYVRPKLEADVLTQHDMEYLLLHYHRIHDNSIPDNAGDDWECDVQSCQYEFLADKVDQQAMICNQFLTQRKYNPVRERRVQPSTLQPILEEQPDATGDSTAKSQNGSTNGAVAHPKNHNCLQEDLNKATSLSTGNQQEAFQMHFPKGYYSRVTVKVQSLPGHDQKSEKEIHDLVESLTSVELYREKFSCFHAIVEETCEQHLLVASMDKDRVDKAQLHYKRATDNVHERYSEVTKFPVKLVLFIKQDQHGGGSGDVQPSRIIEAPLHAAILIADHLFEWDETSLVIPRKSDPAKVPALTTGILYGSSWFTYVTNQRSKLDETVASPPDCLHDREIELMIQLTAKKDDLIKSFITTIVDYNKNKTYNSKSCNNRHFIRDLAKALGIKSLPAFGTSLKQQLEKSRRRCSRRLSRAELSTHANLDAYVSELGEAKLSELTTFDLEYLVGKYFHCHVESWETSALPDQWSCKEANCQLDKIEEQLERTALSGQSSCVVL